MTGKPAHFKFMYSYSLGGNLVVINSKVEVEKILNNN